MTNAQFELNKRRESELAKLRRDLEEANTVHESTAVQLKKKHQDAVNEMSEQIEVLHKTKNKMEKEKHKMRDEIEEVKALNEQVTKAKVCRFFL